MDLVGLVVCLVVIVVFVVLIVFVHLYRYYLCLVCFVGCCLGFVVVRMGGLLLVFVGVVDSWFGCLGSDVLVWVVGLLFWVWGLGGVGFVVLVVWGGVLCWLLGWFVVWFGIDLCCVFGLGVCVFVFGFGGIVCWCWL